MASKSRPLRSRIVLAALALSALGTGCFRSGFDAFAGDAATGRGDAAAGLDVHLDAATADLGADVPGAEAGAIDAVAVDLDARVDPDGAVDVDAGGATAMAGDFDLSGCVDCADIAYMEQQLSSQNPDPAADLNGDGEVGLGDATIITGNLGNGCIQPLAVDLEVQASGMENYSGTLLRGALLPEGGSDWLPLFTTSVATPIVTTTSGGALVMGQRYLFAAYLDLDSDRRCAVTDLAWAEVLDVTGCRHRVFLSPLTENDHAAACPAFAIEGDITGDGCVDGADQAALLAAMGQSGPALPEDVNDDGTVTDNDNVVLLANWGLGCSASDGGSGDRPFVGDGSVTVVDAVGFDLP